ncbi:uncharacterized protein LOC144180293 [Haemaphysalis longicornis]
MATGVAGAPRAVPSGKQSAAHAAIVPVGAAPVVPSVVPPAHFYDEDDDEADDDTDKQPEGAESIHGPSVLILTAALLLVCLLAAVSFYAIGTRKVGDTAKGYAMQGRTETPATSATPLDDSTTAARSSSRESTRTGEAFLSTSAGDVAQRDGNASHLELDGVIVME